jgi:hypothetical protein
VGLQVPAASSSRRARKAATAQHPQLRADTDLCMWAKCAYTASMQSDWQVAVLHHCCITAASAAQDT